MLYPTRWIKVFNAAHLMTMILQITQVIGFLAPNAVIVVSYVLIWRAARKASANVANLG